jgi:hypothetical protein
VPDKNEKAIQHMQAVIRIDPKYYGKNITRDDIIKDLRDTGKIDDIRLSKKFEDLIKANVSRHNAEFTKKDIQKYRAGNTSIISPLEQWSGTNSKSASTSTRVGSHSAQI